MDELAWPWLPPLVVAAALGIAVVVFVAAALLAARRRRGGIPIANMAVLTGTARFRRRLRVYRALIVVGLAVTAAAVVVGAFTAARTVNSTTITPETKNRDIVLCLDVSGSMSNLDAAVLDSFENLAADFTGERVSLVLFDGSPLQIFPLTTDYEHIVAQLQTVNESLDNGRYSEGTNVGGGISLVGDGIAGCLLQFDQLDQPRSRTLILATDYRSAGESLIATDETTTLAIDRGVKIYGLNPSHKAGREASVQFERDVAATGGLYFGAATDAASDAAVGAIVAGVTSDAATAVKEAPIRITADSPDASIWLFSALVLAVLFVLWWVRL
jgi:Ca-activated chloride channel family protein